MTAAMSPDGLPSKIDHEPAKYAPRRPSIARTSAEFASLTRRARIPADAIVALCETLPHGDGGAVLVLPGVLRSDTQTIDLRAFLDVLGYQPFGWDLGTNHGPLPSLMHGAQTLLESLAERHGLIAVVGFSMGGLLARWLACRATACVSQVITVGSPVRAALDSAFVPAPLLKYAWRGQDLDAMAAEIARPAPVPVTHVFSRRDGIVAWESCCDPTAPHTNVEVNCPHVLMEQDFDVFRAIALRLARSPQPRD
jgi:pimeloyl-ACP methyl ester carboxylesterase